MKQILFLFALLLTATYLQGQRLEGLPPPSDVPKEYRAEYRERVRLVREQVAEAERQGYDIILPPLEQVPTDIDRFNLLTQTNWGEQVLLPPAVRQRIKTECLWPVVVKITDTGGKLTHSDLLIGQLPGSTYTGETDPEDGNGHGLHVAGIIAAHGLGLAWDLAEAGRLKFKPVKILNNGGSGSFTWVANAYANERANDIALRTSGTAVVYSGSFGGGTAIVPAVEAELQKSVNAGAYFVFANGNTGGAVNYPGMSPLAIGTASLDQSMTVSSYSSRGPETANAMPGRNINSTWKGNAYATLSGTSMATPFLAAASAISLSKWGMAKLPTQAALKAYLAKVATDIPPPGRDDPSGWGVVYILSILNTEPTGGTPPPPPPPPPPPATKVAVATTIGTGYTIRYTLDNSSAQRILQVKEIDLYVEAETAEKSIEAAREWCDKYFPAHQIAQIPAKDGPEGGLLGAGYWAGQFLEYYAKNNGGSLQVTRLVAADEFGRTFTVMGFDRADVPPEYDSKIPQLIKLK